ncbi:hypothetical protein [Paenibacillus lemnae]|uniref:hypothetical protein n=1 Tax=Paenibacillus lemnae TaxID=1330551 RepID=UPI001B7D54D9|nr:hypothetical protein [Paenibacillus lemnae]
MKVQKWDTGGKLVLVAACAAWVSFFFNWVDIGLLSQNGFSQGVVFFILLFVYPLLTVVREKRMNKSIGYILAAAGIVFAIIYISSKSLDLLGSSMNTAGSGPYLFMTASALMAAGIYKRAK